MFTKECENQSNFLNQKQSNLLSQTPLKKRNVRKELNYIKPKERKPEQPIEEISEFQALVKDVFRNLSSGNKYVEDYCFHKSQLTEILGLCKKVNLKVTWEEKEGIYYIRKGAPMSKVPIPQIQETLRHNKTPKQ